MDDEPTCDADSCSSTEPSQPDEKGALLEELLRRVTPENIHGEVDTGEPVGREFW